LHSQRKYEDIELKKCMLSISAEFFVLKFAVKKYKDENVQKYSMAVVMYGYDTWFLILVEEHKMRVF
jgi:hypothetical protein